MYLGYLLYHSYSPLMQWNNSWTQSKLGSWFSHALAWELSVIFSTFPNWLSHLYMENSFSPNNTMMKVKLYTTPQIAGIIKLQQISVLFVFFNLIHASILQMNSVSFLLFDLLHNAVPDHCFLHHSQNICISLCSPHI